MLLRRFYAPSSVVLVALLGCTLVGGCGLRQPTRPSGTGPLSIPAATEARLLSRQIGSRTPDRLQWKWSVIGGRCWTAAKADGPLLQLTESYALNDPAHAHGTNVWEYDLTVERPRTDPKIVRWTALLHGTNGSKAAAQGSVTLADKGASLADVVQILQDADSVQELPINLPLARLGNQELLLGVEK